MHQYLSSQGVDGVDSFEKVVVTEETELSEETELREVALELLEMALELREMALENVLSVSEQLEAGDLVDCVC